MILKSKNIELQKAAPAARKVAWAASFVILAFSISLSVLPPSMLLLQPEMGLSTARVANLSAVMFVPFLAMVGVGGYLLRWVSKGSLASTGAAGIAVGCAMVGASSDFGGLAVGIAALGAGAGIVEASAPALISSLWEGSKRTAAMNYSQVAFAAGSIGVPAGMAVLIRSEMSWRIGFWAGAAVAVASMAWMVASGAARAGAPAPIQARSGIVPDGFTLLLAFAMFLYVAAEVAFCYWLPLYFRGELHSADEFAALSNGVFWTGAIIGRLGAGYLGRIYSDITLLRVSATAGAVVLIAFMFSPGPAAGIATVALSGLAFACIWPTILSYAGHVYGDSLGASFPWIIGAGAVGAAAGPVLLGAIAAATSTSDAFGMNPAFFVIIALIMFIAPSQERRAKI